MVDFAGVHTYPIWEKKSLDQAMAFTLENLQAVQQALPGVPLAIAEAGWASTASEFPAEANEKNQARYFRELLGWAGKNHVTVFWFEAFDEDWKGDPNNAQGAEKHWGLYDLDRQPKLVAREALPGLANTKKKKPLFGGTLSQEAAGSRIKPVLRSPITSLLRPWCIQCHKPVRPNTLFCARFGR